MMTRTEAFPGVSSVIRSVRIVFPVSMMDCLICGCSACGTANAILP